MRAAVLALLVAACGHHFDPQQAARLDASAPALGAPAPDAPVKTPSGAAASLAQTIAAHPQTIVVFYRGFY